MPSNRRNWITCVFSLAALPALAVFGRRAQGAEPQVVKLVAQRFRYTPREFTVRVGQPVVLEFTSLDFVHGFSMPDMKLRADLAPGVVTPVRFTPVTTGSYDFLCDNFCGDKHEEMSGRMLVASA